MSNVLRADTGAPTIVVRCNVDARRTWWYDPFFDDWPLQKPLKIMKSIACSDVDIATISRSPDLIRRGLGSSSYWHIYVKGYTQFADAGSVGPGNVLFDYLCVYGGAARHDPGLATELSDPTAAVARLERRFADFDRFLRHSSDERSPYVATAAVSCVVEQHPLFVRSAPRDRFHWPLYRLGARVPIEVTALDGYHRLFLARLFGVVSVPCDFHFPA